LEEGEICDIQGIVPENSLLDKMREVNEGPINPSSGGIVPEI
jgi:hypothetical protein